MAFPLLALILVIATAVGQRIVRRALPELDAPGLRLTLAGSFGLGALALLVFGCGLLGLLAPVPVALGASALLALCRLGLPDTWHDLRAVATAPHGRETLAIRACFAATAAVFGAIVLINCFVPPAAHEWDALSYHLAAPKVYLQHHRILFLPTDHHSNFPFLVEMLFTAGLMFQGVPLANLMHFALAVLTVAATLGFGARLFGPRAGFIGAVVFVTAPIVLWEAGIAYIEMGMTLYVLIAVCAALEFRQSQQAGWLAVAGIAGGLAMSVKTLAIVPIGLVLILLMAERTPFRALRWYLLFAVVLGCPFYAKSWVQTGNPVYPFAYRVFGGKYWDAELAATYSGEQRGFGLNRQMVGPRDDFEKPLPEYADPSVAERLRNLVVAPFELVAVPRLYYNRNDAGSFTHLGFLFLALPALLGALGASRQARWCGLLLGLWFITWGLSMQYVRYIIPMLPLLGMIGGEGVERLARRAPAARFAVAAVVVVQAALTLSIFVPRVAENAMLVGTANGPQMREYPGQWQLATDADAQREYLERSVNAYTSTEWLNANTPAGAGVVLFEETRGFYLDRPYLWGNAGHSRYIPYPTFADGREMAAWFIAHGYRYALINLQFAPQAQTAEGNQALGQAVATHTEEALLRSWYTPHGDRDGERWRWLLGDALITSHAVVIPPATARGAVVVEWRD